MRFVVVALTLLAVPVSVGAETPAPKVTDRNDPNYVICRRESVTGSLAQERKVCMTRAQWAARASGNQDAAQAMQDKGRISSCGSGQPGVC